MACGAPAVWQLAPADSYGEYCDDCVPRGCSCNIIDIGNPRARKQHRDKRGRLLPCCEYDFDENGFPPDPPDKVEAYRHRTLHRLDATDPELAKQCREIWGLAKCA
jgi:hypothetical protein